MPLLKKLITLRRSKAVILPAAWLKSNERRLGTEIVEVEMEVGDDLVIRAPTNQGAKDPPSE